MKLKTIITIIKAMVMMVGKNLGGYMIIGRIEIASKEYWKWMMQGDAELYCTLLFIGDKNDWRMIKDAEEMKYIRDNYIVDYVHELSNTYMLGSFFNGQMGYVVPVRDI